MHDWFLCFLALVAWRDKLFVGTWVLLTCSTYKRYSYNDLGDGCLSWVSWSSRCSFHSSCNLIFFFFLIYWPICILCRVVIYVYSCQCCCWFQVVGSLNWPLISRYRASIRTQSPKVEMIDALYKPLANGNDDGIIRYMRRKNNFCKTVIPRHVIILIYRLYIDT